MRKLIIILTLLQLFACNNQSKKQYPISLIPVKTNSGYQYIDWNGKIVINPQFAEANLFYDELALVGIESKEYNKLFGFINIEGKYIIEPKFSFATSFNEGIAWVTEPLGYPYTINIDGKRIFELKNAEFVTQFFEGKAAFGMYNEKEDKTLIGFVNTNGETIINPQFYDIGNGFSEGFCAVANKDGKHGYIDKTGKLVINYQFAKAKNFKNGYASVKLEDKYGIIDKKGKFILNPQYETIENDGDMFLIQQNGKYGWCDIDGKTIINPQFNNARAFGKEHLAAVQSGEKWGYINTKGTFEINPQFIEATSFVNDKAFVKIGSSLGIIDLKGNYLVNPQFENISFDYISYLNDGISEAWHIQSHYFDFESEINNLISLTKEVINKEQLNLSFEESIKRFPFKCEFKNFENSNSFTSIYKKKVHKTRFEVEIIGSQSDLHYSTTGDIFPSFNPNKPPEGFSFEVSHHEFNFTQKFESIKNKLLNTFKDYQIINQDLESISIQKNEYVIGIRIQSAKVVITICNINNGNLFEGIFYGD